MIDQELDQLSRALIAATDRLNSEDFRARQARYIELEQEFLALGNELEAEEKAVEAAQAALTSYVNGNYLDLGGVADEATEGDDALVESEYSGNMTRYFQEYLQETPYRNLGSPVEPLPTEEEQSWDETASARGSGGLNDFPN